MTAEEQKKKCQEIQEMILKEMDCNHGVTDEEILASSLVGKSRKRTIF